ncbi:MAG: type IV pilus biogenesis/stability protein PilW [Thiotrichaceae bacterium]|nr:type IV pilus biogenesis/stability protein PilW [Thiotrichaceae bacterium]
MMQKISILFLVLLLNACGENIQDDNAIQNDRWQGQTDDYIPNEIVKNKMLRGIEYMKLKKNTFALDILKKAVALDPNYGDAHHTLAYLYDRMKIIDGASWHYQKALSLKPNDPLIHNNYAQFLCQQKQWETANKHFLQAVEHAQQWYPEIPYTNAGWCALSYNNNFSQAKKYFHQALQKNKKYARPLYLLALVNYKQKRYAQARHYLQQYELNAKPTPQTVWLRIRVERFLNQNNAVSKYSLYLRQNFPTSQETQLLNQSP